MVKGWSGLPVPEGNFAPVAGRHASTHFLGGVFWFFLGFVMQRSVRKCFLPDWPFLNEWGTVFPRFFSHVPL